MIIQLTASAVRARAKRAGFDKTLIIRTGRPAENRELEYVAEGECSVRIAVMTPGVEEFMNSLRNKTTQQN